jgi:hypothetical protein
MKIRAIGTGSAFCRHPLVTPSFLIQSESSNVLIGCGPNLPAKLETINLSIAQIDMWVLPYFGVDQVGGIFEIASKLNASHRPYLVAPSSVLQEARSVFKLVTGKPLDNFFSLRAVKKIAINEEHFSEEVVFVDNYFGEGSFGLYLENSQIFITGRCEFNDDFLHHYGAQAELILHECGLKENHYYGRKTTSLTELQTLPLYLQKKLWIYGYDNSYLEVEDPIPMLFLPQGTCLFDSERKEKHLDKERFIRENSKRQIGNVNSLPSS